ncbi:hypothetical protein EKE94_03230 [Mesobaculum littorinae]|uniref:Uncharacterized protein n=1 Tax=Mesobaculum littorinae TaxID=2486419 RepID=A0A438ALT2_9RHOB|nr:hypothetical protein [Mesobaculum littorinae]RVV99708.1 hypothetical protein EKE94_03230 [Mesobaculum littorinae]
MPDRVILRFTKAWSKYNVGEIAGFDPGRARQLIGKVAKVHEPDEATDAALIEARNAEAEEKRLIEREAAIAAREADLDRREAAMASPAPTAPAPNTDPGMLTDPVGNTGPAKAPEPKADPKPTEKPTAKDGGKDDDAGKPPAQGKPAGGKA